MEISCVNYHDKRRKVHQLLHHLQTLMTRHNVYVVYILLSQPSKCIWIGYFSVVLLGQTYSLQSAAELGLPNTQTDEGSSSPSSLATLKRKSSNKIHHHTHLLVYFPFSFVVLKGILFCCLHFELCVAICSKWISGLKNIW